MKRTLSLILALILTFSTLFSLTSCFGTQADVKGLTAKITELTEQISEANSKISILEAEKAAQSAEITNLKANIEVLEADKATLTENKLTLESDKASLEEKVADLEAEIARLQALMDGNSNKLLEEIAELEAQIDSLEAEVTALNSTKANIESQISTLNAQISTLDTEKVTLTARITDLEASIAAKNTEIANLNSNVSALTTEKNALVAENSGLKEENEELKALVTALRNCLKDIHTYVDGFCTTCGKQQEEIVYVRCDKDGTPNANGEYILFGEYPQTIKADDVTITSTTDERGYFLGSDGEYYAKAAADPSVFTDTFSNGATIIEGSLYYFKVEPIRWRILSEKNGEVFILCDSIIDIHRFDGSSNNYAKSEIRVWLNDTFYNTVFSTLQKTIIFTTEVDNSAKSTNPYGNETKWNNGVNNYACENTNDRIFLLSYEEATNTSYGFSSNTFEEDTYRKMLTSDYSKAMGLQNDSSSGRGPWMLRSPNYNSNNVCLFNSRGGPNIITYVDNRNSDHGIVPALRIKL